MTSPLSAGFSRVNITPPMGMPIGGYYHIRLAERVLDELEASALALSHGDVQMLLISVDLLGLEQGFINPIRQCIAARTGVPEAAVLIACTHTHTGPLLRDQINPEMQESYFHFLKARLGDAALFALEDLRPAKAYWAVGHAPGISFIRRFRMKDGSIRTNPGIHHPDVVHPMGTPDEGVGVLRFDRENAPSIVLAHFGVHPDTIGGCVISGDWPGFARRMVEKSLDNTRCMLFNGVQGDVNHVNPAPGAGDLNDLKPDFDDVLRGYGHARHMGNVIAGAVLQVYAKGNPLTMHALCAMQRTIHHPSNQPRPEDMPWAHQMVKLHQENRDHEIPWEGMMFTTAIAEAQRMVQLEHGPETFALQVSVMSIGDVALVGIPGEPFTSLGRTLKAAPGWALVLPCCCANGYEGYFPAMEDYQEAGSYETRSSIFQAGVGEALCAAALDMLGEMKRMRR